MRRLGVLLALVCLAFAGCGGHHQKTLSPLDDALGYFSKDAPFVAAIETDPSSDQIKQVASLIGRFPSTDVLAARINNLTRVPNVRWERDVRPQLGAPLVVGLAKPAAGSKQLAVATVVAMRIKHPLRVKQVILRQPNFRGQGKESGVRVYENKLEHRYLAVDGNVLVGATDRGILAEALSLKRSDNRMRDTAFLHDIAGLPTGALVRISADPRTMIGADARLRPALDVKWLAAMRRMGAAIKAGATGLTLDLHIATEKGSLADSDLPLQPGSAPIALIGGKKELQIGVRDPARLARFGFAAWQAIAPGSLKALRALEPSRVNLEQQIPHHLANVALLALDPFSKQFALRLGLREPADVRDSLVPLAPVLPGLAALLGIRGIGVATPEVGEHFYAVAKPNARTVVFGVVGNSLVAASQARRAAGLASDAGRVVPAAKGGAVMTLNAREIVGRLLARRLRGPVGLLAPLAVSSLRDLTGGLTISRSGLKGHFKLTIVR